MRQVGKRWVLVLVVLVLLLALPGAEGKSRSSAKRRKRRSRTWKARLRECDEGVCAHLVKDENANCVNRCASAACFDQIYAAEPLEDGEVDAARDALFKKCLAAEAKQTPQQRREQQQQRREQEQQRQQQRDKEQQQEDGQVQQQRQTAVPRNEI